MADATFERSRLATVFGGSGFLGRHIVRALVRRGWRVRPAVRRPDLAAFLRTMGLVGQVEPVQANLRYPASIAAALEGAEMVVNAAGVRAQSGAQTYQAVHVEGAAALARAATAAGIETFAHISGIGADAKSASAYIASKGLGETATLEAFPDATVLRPSVVFGPEDDFFNRFGALSRFLPIIPLFGGGKTRLQPVYAGDVARATAAALAGEAVPGTIYELGGPQVIDSARGRRARLTHRRPSPPPPRAASSPLANDRFDDFVRRQGDVWPLSEAPDHEPRSGGLACLRQCRLGGGRGGAARLPRPRNRAAGARRDHPSLSCAVPQDGSV